MYPGALNSRFTVCPLSLKELKISIISPEVKTVPNFFVWCTADGKEPIHMTLAHSSTPLASGVGLVYAKITHRGNYTCTARNEIGMVSRDFAVVVIGKKH